MYGHVKEDWKGKLEYQRPLRIFRVEMAMKWRGENMQTKIQTLKPARLTQPHHVKMLKIPISNITSSPL